MLVLRHSRQFSAAILLLLAKLAAGQATAPDPTLPPGSPPVLLQAIGRGVQIYTCKGEAGKAAADGTPAWTFTAPEAKLYDAAGVELGSHGAGPHWTLNDGSTVRGKLLTQQASPVAGAVPWLLLTAVGAQGPGLLAGATYIRRSDTIGGKARAEGCDAFHLGAQDRVSYSATYTFYGTK